MGRERLVGSGTADTVRLLLNPLRLSLLDAVARLPEHPQLSSQLVSLMRVGSRVRHGAGLTVGGGAGGGYDWRSTVAGLGSEREGWFGWVVADTLGLSWPSAAGMFSLKASLTTTR